MSSDRTLRWCAKHEEPAWVYHDGSVGCWYDSIVGANTHHQIVNLPQDDEIVRLQAAGDALAKWLWRGGGDLADMIAAVAAWEEARRER